MARQYGWKNAVKPVVAAAIPLLTAFGSLISTGEWNASEWSLAITGLATAIVVFFLPNEQTGWRAWTKAIGAAATPVVSALIQGLATGSFSRAELTTAVVGFITALLMAFVQNTPDS
jgi:hypothetical protein